MAVVAITRAAAIFFRRISKFSPLSSDLLKNDNCNNDSCSCQDISNLSKMSKLFEKAIVAASILVFYFVCLTQCHPVTTKTRERKCKRKFFRLKIVFAIKKCRSNGKIPAKLVSVFPHHYLFSFWVIKIVAVNEFAKIYLVRCFT